MVRDPQTSFASNLQDGQIIFMRIGPLNLLPYVNEYEKWNTQNYDGRKKGILEGKHGLAERELLRRERGLINSYLQIPCKAQIVSHSMGKIPNSLKNAIYIEYD